MFNQSTKSLLMISTMVLIRLVLTPLRLDTTPLFESVLLRIELDVDITRWNYISEQKTMFNKRKKLKLVENFHRKTWRKTQILFQTVMIKPSSCFLIRDFAKAHLYVILMTNEFLQRLFPGSSVRVSDSWPSRPRAPWIYLWLRFSRL